MPAQTPLEYSHFNDSIDPHQRISFPKSMDQYGFTIHATCRSGKTILPLWFLYPQFFEDGTLDLRRWQGRCVKHLGKFGWSNQRPVKKAMIVFSSRPVLDQFCSGPGWIEKYGLAGVRKIINVSSSSAVINKKKVVRTTDVEIISQHLQSNDDVLFLTTYASVSKVNDALGIYIRFNPDKYIAKTGKRKNPAIATRLEKLKLEIEKQIGRAGKSENVELVDYFIFLLFSERRKNNFAFSFSSSYLLIVVLHFT